MAIKVYFDDSLILENGLMSLSQSGELFDSTFKLGATLCRQVTLQVASKFLPTYDAPSKVKIYEDDDLKFTLYVDSMERVDEMSYSYTLVDSMVKLNVALSDVFEWDTSKSYTVQEIVNNICDYVGSTHATIDYIGTLAISWDWDTQARDFLSYVGEINASYVRISPSGNIEFIEHKKATTRQLDIATCEDIAIGEYHCIQRVGYEQASASIYYPTSDVEYNTVYISQDNILITDSGDFTREDIIQHIYDKIVNFEFYSMTINRCQVDQNAIAGDNLSVAITQEGFLSSAAGKMLLTSLGQRIYIRLKEKKYIPTIVQINWDYNAKWNGGYELQIDSLQQEETQIVDSTEKKVNSLKITVDRELGVIKQEITEVDEKVDDVSTNLTENYSTTTQTAQSIESAVSQSKTEIEGDVAKTLQNYSTIEQTSTSINLAVEQSEKKIEENVAENYPTKEDVSNTYATQASLKLYVTTEDANETYVREDEASNQVASWIEASATNIIIKYDNSLIFGDYPNGQYMKVRTNDSNNGVLFQGTGTFTTKSVGDFSLLNYADSDYTSLKNRIYTYTNANSPAIDILNYDGGTHVANALKFYNVTNESIGKQIRLYNVSETDASTTSRYVSNEFFLAFNYHYNDNHSHINLCRLSNACYNNTTQLANRISQISSASNWAATYIYNFDAGVVANELYMQTTDTLNKIEFFNNQLDSTLNANRLNFEVGSVAAMITLCNYSVGSAKVANKLLMYQSNSGGQLTLCNPYNGEDGKYNNIIQLSTGNSLNYISIQNCLSGETINKLYMSTDEGTKIQNQNSYLEFDMSQNTTLQSKYGLNIISTDHYVTITTDGIGKKCIWKNLKIGAMEYYVLTGE